MEILTSNNNHEIWFMMIPVTLFTVFLLLGAYIGYEEKKIVQWVSLSAISATLLFGSIVFCINESDKEVLKVTITDMDEVNLDKYIIDGNEGKIITLREK